LPAETNPPLQPWFGGTSRWATARARGEGAEGSFELLMQKAITRQFPRWRRLSLRAIVANRQHHGPPLSEPTITAEAPAGAAGAAVAHTGVQGTAPVNAPDRALRKALSKF